MNKYVAKVTLTSPAGSLVVVNPQGLLESPLTLARDKVFRSVLEGFDAPLTFVLHAVDFINAAKVLGVDTLLTMLVEISSDFGVTFEQLAQGVLDLPAISTLSDPTDYKIQLSCKKSDVWTKFINRQEVDVDVLSIVDLDDIAVAPAIIEDISLSTQVIQRLCRMEMWATTDTDFVDFVFSFSHPNPAAGPTPDYIMAPFDLPKKVLDEVLTKNNYTGAAFNLTRPNVPFSDYGVFSCIEAVEAATMYEIDFRVSLTPDNTYHNHLPANDNVLFPVGPSIRFYFIRVDEDMPDAVTSAIIVGVNNGITGVDGRTQYEYSTTEGNIKKGTKIFILVHYLNNIGYDGSGGDFPFDAYVVPSDIYGDLAFLEIKAHTTFPPSTTKAIRVGESLDAITKRICGNFFHSDFFADCGLNYVNMLGLHLRGYDFTTKPFTTNFLAQFQAASSIWNLGLGYELIAGVRKIVIEKAEHFFDASSNSIELSYINNYTKTFKVESIAKSIVIGYNKWQLTAGGSLIDDPQTQHTYSTPFKYVGQAISNLCQWVAASLLFELTRRAIDKLSDTFDTDNDIFILAINGSNEAKLDYVAASNLLDPALRYNKEITPGRNFLRRLATFNIGASQYIGRFFKFVSGLGNFLTEIEITPYDCEDTAVVNEHSDIEITSDVLHGIEVINIPGFPLNWEQYKLIRDNPNKAIGISQTGTGHVPYFIDKIDFYLFEKKANFTLFRNV